MATHGVRELVTDRLLLRRSDVVPAEAQLAFFIANVAHLRRWLPEAEPIAHSPAFRAALVTRMQQALAAGSEERWFASLRDDPARVVGYVFLTQFRTDGHRSCELSYGVDAALAGRGVMQEAAAAALAHARDTLGFSCVNARYDVENLGSARLLERLGFVRIGVAPQHAWLAGAWRDHVLVTRVDRDGPPVPLVSVAT
jgi:ribosomal-protein-alanine N-acetyltransferase